VISIFFISIYIPFKDTVFFPILENNFVIK
jgi:hypothetical protein